MVFERHARQDAVRAGGALNGARHCLQCGCERYSAGMSHQITQPPPPPPRPRTPPPAGAAVAGLSLEAISAVRKILDMEEIAAPFRQKIESRLADSPVEIAETVARNLLRDEFDLALREWVLGPPELELVARKRIKLAVERSRAALKYVDELQEQAGRVG